MARYIYCHPFFVFFTEILACLRFDVSRPGLLVDPRTFLSIHIRDCNVILSTVLMISLEYGALDIDPLHVELLMELPVYTRKSAVGLYL